MKHLILLRHGQSVWNLENRFTGWTDVDLSPTGLKEAAEAGDLMLKAGLMPDIAFTSYLKRAIKTLNIVLDHTESDWIEVRKSWRLNEKHYGALQGLNKTETAEKYGAEQVKLWRRSYDTPPQPLAPDDPRSPLLDPCYDSVPRSELPLTESLRTTIERTIPYWECEILPAMMKHDTVLVVAHGNSLRGLVKYIKGISDEDIVGLEIPTGRPWVFDFEPQTLKYRGDRYL